jgi:hypothetical protein
MSKLERIEAEVERLQAALHHIRQEARSSAEDLAWWWVVSFVGEVLDGSWRPSSDSGGDASREKP